MDYVIYNDEGFLNGEGEFGPREDAITFDHFQALAIYNATGWDYEEHKMSMKTESVRIDGLNGTWYMIDSYTGADGTYYLWESEQYGEDCNAVLTDEHLMVIDYSCESGIVAALQDQGMLEY